MNIGMAQHPFIYPHTQKQLGRVGPAGILVSVLSTDYTDPAGEPFAHHSG